MNCKGSFAKVAFSLVLFFSLFSSFSYADSLSLTPTDVWYDAVNLRWTTSSIDTISMTATCATGTTSARADILYGSLTQIKPLTNAGTVWTGPYSWSSEPSGGEYTAKLYCNDTDTNQSATFRVHKLRTDITGVDTLSLSSQSPRYVTKDNALDIFFTIKDNDSPITPIGNLASDIKFRLIIKDSSGELFNEEMNSDNAKVIYTSGGAWKIVAKDLDTTKMSSNPYTIELITTYKGQHIFSDKEQDFFYFGAPVSAAPATPTASLDKITDTIYLTSSTKTATAKIKFTIQNVANFAPRVDHLKAELDGKIVTITQLSCSQATTTTYECDTSLGNIDFTASSEKTLKIQWTNYSGVTTSGTASIKAKPSLELKGIMKDSRGTVIPAIIKVAGSGNFSAQTSVANDGSYLIALPSGEYDLEVTYNPSSAKPTTITAYGVEMTKETLELSPDPITFDNINKNIYINGFSVANLIIFELALPYETVQISAPYDDAKIADDSNVLVMACRTWNSGKSDCDSDWEELTLDANDIRVNTKSNFIIFKTINDKQSAFIIGGRQPLLVSTDKLFDKYYAASTVTLKGKVVDAGNIAVENARVTYLFKGTTTTGEFYTKKTGTFEGEITFPSKAGEYDLIITAVKEPYLESKEMSVPVIVETKKELQYVLAESNKILVDGNSKLKFTLANKGQVDFTNLKLSVSAEGLPREKYTLDPQLISILKAGESKEMTLDIPLTLNYCSQIGCRTFYSFALQAEATELDEPIKATLIANVEVSSGKDSETATQEKKESSFSLPKLSLEGKLTGLVPTNMSSLNGKLLVTFIILAIAVLLFKKPSQGRRPLAGLGSLRDSI